MPGDTVTTHRTTNRRLPRRILMTADAIGGVWTYALELASALEPFGIEIDLAVMGGPLGRGQRAEAAQIPNLNLFKSEYKLEWMPNCWDDVKKSGYWLLNLEDRLCPDIIHLNGYAHATLPWRTPTVVVAHSCVFSWWEAVKTGTPASEWDRYKTVVTRSLNTADIVIAPSQSMLSAVERIYVSAKQRRVIPNGRNPKLFNSQPKQKFIFSAGRVWDEAKNIDSVASVAFDMPWPICIAGDWDRGELAKSPPQRKNCFYLGNIENGLVREWLARAAIYTLPALYEPFGLTVLEAALSGCALVISNIDSLVENWDGAAIFVDPHDKNELRSELLKLINDEAHRTSMARLAFERAQNFTSKCMADEYLDVYSNLLAAKKESSEGDLLACA
jgi:glycogen(starch) synthase